MEPCEIGIIKKTYLSEGELREVKRIAEKSLVTEKELDFVIAMAGRSTRIALNPVPPGIEVRIQPDGTNFSIMRISN
ncbi:MAG: hypothetical protein WAO52_18920 [Prolixibacteraceae bacterium]